MLTHVSYPHKKTYLETFLKTYMYIYIRFLYAKKNVCRNFFRKFLCYKIKPWSTEMSCQMS